MMANDLILINGQEAFVDLELLEEWDLFSNGVRRGSGFGNIPYLSFGKTFRGRFEYIPSDRKERNMLISINISYKNLARIYYEQFHEFDKKIDAVKKKMARARSPVKKKEYNDLVRALLKKKTNIPNPFVDLDIIYSLLEKIPEKYYGRRSQEIVLKKVNDCDCDMYFSCNFLKIKTIAIPYLENQHQLGRIELSKEELTMIKSMKELLKVKEEGCDFDTYIDKWAEKLLKNGGF